MGGEEAGAEGEEERAGGGVESVLLLWFSFLEVMVTDWKAVW